MPRTIYLLSYNSHAFPAHWGIWIPSLTDPGVGRLINVEGDALVGFKHFFERNYDLGSTTRSYTLTTLGEAADNYVVDAPGNGEASKDQIANDYIEQVALSIPAPGPSLQSTSCAVRSSFLSFLEVTWANRSCYSHPCAECRSSIVRPGSDNS
jgi:hypothetical protein